MKQRHDGPDFQRNCSTPDGEHHWSKHYPFCGGTFQSPIDIQTQLLRFDPTLRPIELQNYNLSANEQLTLGNNGHSVQLSLPRRMYISSLPHRYTAAQIHFHWGSEQMPVGSEHTINGRQFAAEMHMVLFNSDKYPNISVAADKSDGLAVLGVLIEVGEFNPAFDQFLKYINGIKYRDQRVQVPAFNIRGLLPALLDEYYRYDGSLTTPPCYPSVLWTVFKNPVTISLKQFLALATTIYSSHQQESAPVPMNSNFRKPQYTDNRVVLCSFQGGRGLQGGVQTVTSPFLRRQIINQLLVGDLADLADQDGLNQLLVGDRADLADQDGLNQLLVGDLADLADQDGLNQLLPKKPRAPGKKWNDLENHQKGWTQTQRHTGSKHHQNTWSQTQNSLKQQWLKPNKVPSGGAGAARLVPSPRKNHQNRQPVWKSGLSEDILCYVSFEQNVSRQLNRGRSPPHTDTQLVQALRETLFPELNLRSYLGCKSDLGLPTIRQLLRGRSATDEALELDQAIVKALGGTGQRGSTAQQQQTVVGQRGSTEKQQTNTLSKHHTGFAPAPAAVPRKPDQPIPWLQPMEWED
ncbi:uncharacterized protein ca12 [Coregonus clupeaformis]|uniref:uncharacterized protein ca12 n=1 Tax=Coregonus clupeaformis TaxID=59861 RepID=UPI001E1C46D2|nr:uncharacterized protein ca12 [Coregonus clupeaformis]